MISSWTLARFDLQRERDIWEDISLYTFRVIVQPRDKARVRGITSAFPLVSSFITPANPALST